jgi:6-phosphogluconolactonase/glucosamine-6-phosphate isomerase/deaminase
VHKSAGEGFAVANRISITLPVIQKAHTRVFLLKGAGKQTTWASMMSAGDTEVDRLRWPAKNLLGGGVSALCLFPVSAKI